jgi:tetratricopeptide (TPR) repeat protein
MRQIERSTWVAGIVLGALTVALITLVLLPVSILQENATALHKVHPNAEGLEKAPQGFTVMPFEGRSQQVSTVHDLLRGEKVTPERDFILGTYDMADGLVDAGKYREAIEKFNLGIAFIDKLEKQKALSKIGSPDSVNIHRSDYYSERPYAYLQLKQYKQGIADINRAMHFRPTYDVLYKNRAKAYELIGKPHLAAADLKKAEYLKGAPTTLERAR